jgi:excisionase family DNA binding protein
MTRPKQRSNPGEKLWSVDDLASYLQVSPSTVYNWVDQRRLPYIDLGAEGRRRCIRFDPKALEEFLRNSQN